jgi:cell division protein FtsB
VSRLRPTTIVLVLVTAVAVGYVLFVPARSYLDQRQATDRTQDQLDALDEEIAELEQRAVELQDPAELERLAREEFNLVEPGEESFAVLPDPPQPLPIPSGWPFDVLRGAAAAGTDPPG